MRFLYHNWRPTRFGQFVDRLNCWWAGRKSGRTRSNPVAIATVEGKQYLVCILGQDSDWVWSVEAAHGDATIHQGRRRHLHLVVVPPEERAPVLREYVRIAPSGRQHFQLGVGSPLSDFAAIAERYPVYRIDPRLNYKLARPPYSEAVSRAAHMCFIPD